jgi:hypothetical protein
MRRPLYYLITATFALLALAMLVSYLRPFVVIRMHDRGGLHVGTAVALWPGHVVLNRVEAPPTIRTPIGLHIQRVPRSAGLPQSKSAWTSSRGIRGVTYVVPLWPLAIGVGIRGRFLSVRLAAPAHEVAGSKYRRRDMRLGLSGA